MIHIVKYSSRTSGAPGKIRILVANGCIVKYFANMYVGYAKLYCQVLTRLQG